MIKKAATTRKKATATKKRVTKTTTRKKSTKPAKSTAKKSTSARKYSPLAGAEVGKELALFKKGKAKSGKTGLPVTSRAQAIAIGLSEARAKGAKVPKKRK